MDILDKMWNEFIEIPINNDDEIEKIFIVGKRVLTGLRYGIGLTRNFRMV